MKKEGGLEHIILLQIKCQVRDIVQALISLRFSFYSFFQQVLKVLIYLV